MPQTKPEPLPRARPSDHQRWEAPRSCEVCGVRPQQQCWLDSLGRREAGDAQVRTPQFNSPQTRVRPSLLRAMLASTTDCNCFFLLANLYTAVSTEKIACQTWIRQHSYRLRTYVRTYLVYSRTVSATTVVQLARLCKLRSPALGALSGFGDTYRHIRTRTVLTWYIGVGVQSTTVMQCRGPVP